MTSVLPPRRAQAVRLGAFDYIAKPFELDRMLETLKRAEASLEAVVSDDDRCLEAE